ncbi:MAG: hypothetical protein NTW12_08175 [Deltaproteobacteria bacterium]|nr:hypothetical protein [Deltaproteobacteria bacterium]
MEEVYKDRKVRLFKYVVMLFSFIVLFTGSAFADDNKILGFKVVSQTSNELVIEVTYNYSGDHGDNVFIKVVPAIDRKSSRFFGYKPNRISAGINTLTTKIKPNPKSKVPDGYTTNQLGISMYVGGQGTFLAPSYYDFEKNWSE